MSTESITFLAQADVTVEQAASRAFGDLSKRWTDVELDLDDPDARLALRNELMQAVEELGFADILETLDDRDAWADAAGIIRAQAATATPVDMALWIATGDKAAAAEQDPIELGLRGQARQLTDSQQAALILGRALQCTAVMQASLELAVEYVKDRVQFGRALAKFQVIQHDLAKAAEEIAVATAVTHQALAAAIASGIDSARVAALLDAACIVVDQASDVVYTVTQQVHGAIGFTREYSLHRLNINLLRWRDEMMLTQGNGAARRLGDMIAQRGMLWPHVTGLMNQA